GALQLGYEVAGIKREAHIGTVAVRLGKSLSQPAIRDQNHPHRRHNQRKNNKLYPPGQALGFVIRLSAFTAKHCAKLEGALCCLKAKGFRPAPTRPSARQKAPPRPSTRAAARRRVRDAASCPARGGSATVRRQYHPSSHSGSR